MILENLIEKKDINAYIDGRIARLFANMHRNILNVKQEDREKARAKIYGRIDELRCLKRVVNSGKLKEKSKALWKANQKQI
jgi:hypothetical protein